MPIHYNNRVYKNWSSLVRAIKRSHPAWTTKRVNAYAGGLKKRQESKVRKHGGK